ncbi:MAG TPA: LTA synthase family protein [Motiliproteus sp.]
MSTEPANWLSYATLYSLPLGLLLSLQLERALQPRPQPFRQRSARTQATHLALWTLLFTLLLAGLQRPLFALTLSLALQLFLIVVNNVKYATLREPFLVQDFEYFWDMLKHPRLYIPFFGLWRTLLFSLLGVSVIGTGLWLEPPVTQQGWDTLTLMGLVGSYALGAALLLAGVNRHPPLCRFSPNQDFHRLGPLACFWEYGRALFGQQPLPQGATCFSQPTPPQQTPPQRPHLVLVQSESFADPRRLTPAIKPDLLRHFDQLRATALLQGRLQVPAWGANTVRTECTVLTGLTSAELGIHAFNPYRSLAKQGIPNLASYLRQQGYRTCCIHPYPASFYLRDQVFPKLGFDHFIDIEAFKPEQKQGQYIGDLAVADKVCELLQSRDERPLFIFVITMENHGPLHLEREDPALTQRWCSSPLPEACSDLAVYVGHIANADRMLAQLQQQLQQDSRPGVLGWYGDHLPIMPQVYATLGEPDGRTDYLIWRSDSSIAKTSAEVAAKVPTAAQDLRADQLAAALIHALQA